MRAIDPTKTPSPSNESNSELERDFKRAFYYWKECLCTVNLENYEFTFFEQQFAKQIRAFHYLYFNTILTHSGYIQNPGDEYLDSDFFLTVYENILLKREEAIYNNFIEKTISLTNLFKAKLIPVICDFFIKNENFFLAPFENPTAFQNWLSKNPSCKRTLVEINEKFKRLFSNSNTSFKEFLYAISGKEKSDGAPLFRLSNKQTDSLKDFLLENDDIANFFSDINNLEILGDLASEYDNFVINHNSFFEFSEMLNDKLIFNFLKNIFGQWGAKVLSHKDQTALKPHPTIPDRIIQDIPLQDSSGSNQIMLDSSLLSPFKAFFDDFFKDLSSADRYLEDLYSFLVDFKLNENLRIEYFINYLKVDENTELKIFLVQHRKEILSLAFQFYAQENIYHYKKSPCQSSIRSEFFSRKREREQDQEQSSSKIPKLV